MNLDNYFENYGTTGFSIAGSGVYCVHSFGKKIKIFVESSIDSLESKYELTKLVKSDTTKVYLTVLDVNMNPIAVNLCYIIDDKIYGDVTDGNGKVFIKFMNDNLPENIKVGNLFYAPAYIPVYKSKTSYFKVFLKNQPINFFKSGIVKIKISLIPELKKIKVRSVKIIKEPVNTCL